MTPSASPPSWPSRQDLSERSRTELNVYLGRSMSYPADFTPVPRVHYNTCKFQNPSGTFAVCGLWAEPDKLAAAYPNAYMVGPCYSAAGADMIVRTILANPQIHELLVTGPDLSKTRDDIRREFLEEWKDNSLLKQLLRSGEGAIYDRYLLQTNRYKIVFPLREPAADVRPSLGRGWPGQRIVGATLWEVWPRVLREIVNHGAESPTAYGTRQRELLAPTWVFGVEATLHTMHGAGLVPAWFAHLEGVGQGEQALDDYAAVHFLGSAPKPEGIAYTYADRLRSMGDDQIARCVETLRKDPEQRRAVAVTWDVGTRAETHMSIPAFGSLVPEPYKREGAASDAASSNPPCLVGLWFRRDADGSLFTHATFRSHDLPKAGVQNAWGLCRLAEQVAQDLGWPIGRLAICSLSAHAYDPDWEWVTKLVQERGRGTFEEDSERAILVVRRAQQAVDEVRAVETGEPPVWYLEVDLLDGSGRTITTLRGASAESLEKKVLQAGWVTTLSHAAWLGRELVRAEGGG